MEALSGLRLSWTILFVVVAVMLRFWQRLHQQRSMFKGLPGPPRSYLFGSLISMGKVIAKQPAQAAPQTFVLGLKEEYRLGDFWYLDTWPAGPPMLMIMNTEMANEITNKNFAPKHPLVGEFMKNFGGPGNLVSTDGPEWKKWRSIFNPGFSSNNLMTLVPAIVNQCKVFCDLMEQKAKRNELFRMETAATKLTIDIICKLVLDIDLDSQTKTNELVSAFNSQVRWQSLGVQFQPSELWDIRRPVMQAYNNWRMNRYLGKRLDERFASRESRGKTKHVIDLALESYLKEVKGVSGDTSHVTKLDAEFRIGAVSNMRTFVFAGHDTTSSTICYAYYYLGKNPQMLARIRKEHDDVFGTDRDAAVSRLLEDPRLMNKLEYTLAVIREVLRIQPPASTVRAGSPEYVATRVQ
jgi:cytochrome P450